MDPTGSVLNGLLAKLGTMAKKPALDHSLSEVLDRYVAQLDENDRYLANGIFSTNFGEAALLLQSSVDVYVKKVDVLWEKIIDYQRHIITYQREQDESEARILEERSTRYKRKRRINEEDIQRRVRRTRQEPVQVSHSNMYILSQSFEIDDEVMATWRALGEVDEEIADCVNNNYTGSDATLFQPVDEIDVQDDDTALKYNQIRTTTVIEEIFNLEDNHLLEDLFQGVTRMRIASYVANDYRRRMLACARRKEGYEESLGSFILGFMRQRKKDEHAYHSALQGLKEGSLPNTPNKKLGRISVTDMQQLQDQAENNDSDMEDFEAPLLEPEVGGTTTPSKKLGRISVSDPSNAEPPVLYQEDCFVSLKKLPDELIASQLKGSDCEAVAEVQAQAQADPEEGNDAVCGHSVSDLAMQCHDYALPSDTMLSTSEVRRSTRVKKASQHVMCTQACCMPEELEIQNLSNEDTDDASESETEAPKPKMSKRSLKKLASGVTVSFGQFEKFYFHNYQRGDEEEGSVLELHIITETDSDADTASVCESTAQLEDVNPDDDLQPAPDKEISENSQTTDISQLNDSGLGESFSLSAVTQEESHLDVSVSEERPDESGFCESGIESAVDSMSQLTQPIESLVSTENASCQTPEEFEEAAQDESTQDTDLSDAQSLTEQEKIDKSVNAWKSFITPRLKRIGNKSDFDIHAYGSRLLDSMEVNESKTFGRLVDGMSSSEVARHFIATLQLANTQNVEIEGIQPGKLSNETFSLKVLSKERYHEQLDAYQAPSEETFSRRLARAQSMNPRDQPINFHDQPTTSRAQPTYPRTQPTNLRTQPMNSRAQPTNSRAQPANTRAQPANYRAQPTDPRAQSMNSRAQPVNPRIQPINSHTQPMNSCPQSMNPRVILHSTPLVPPLPKKFKLVIKSHRTLFD